METADAESHSGLSVKPEEVTTLSIASEAFLASMRREFVRKHPNEECFIRSFAEYSASDQLRLMRAIKAALNAASPENLERVRSARQKGA